MIDFKQLAQEYKTPLYVYDFDYMSAQYSELKSAFKARKSLICYAVKANSNLNPLMPTNLILFYNGLLAKLIN